MSTPLATNHERIWLQPLCCVDERCWCHEPQDCDDPGCELPAVEYVRADLAPKQSWQPIETAPKDERLRLWVPQLGEYHGRWFDDHYAKKPRPYWYLESVLGATWSRKNQPTHWMPLPDPPEAS